MYNLQEIVDGIDAMACILSYEKAKGCSGIIRIEAANKLYIDSMIAVNRERNTSCHDNIEFGKNYECYMEKELNFENFSYQCAILKKPIHAYIQPERFNFWLNLFMLPLNIEDPEKAFCIYTQEISEEVNPDTMSSLSVQTSSKVLKTCIKLRGTKDFLTTLNEVVEDIRGLCKADYCCILQTDFKERTYSILADSVTEGSNIVPVSKIKNENFIDYAESWIKTLAGSNCLILENPEHFEIVRQRNPVWYNSMRNANVNSLILLPLQNNNEIIGFIWVTNFDTTQTLSIKETLELSTFFIASEIARFQLLERLEKMSSMDMLTGIYNRNAMNNRVLQFVSGKEQYSNYAVIFADLNGLKTVNDCMGHDKGDLLLKKAAQKLRTEFEEAKVYRAGGDEFVVIATDTPKEKIQSIVDKLHREAQDSNSEVHFAVGCYFDEEGGDIRIAMREADARMYENKKDFYSINPCKR